jgi:hypothetical protein
MKNYYFLVFTTAALTCAGCKSGGGSNPITEEASEDTSTGEAPEDTGTGEAPEDTGSGEAPEDTGSGEPARCAEARCNTPPENTCDGSFEIEISNTVGWCDRGECFYTSRSEVCVGTCEDGACTGAPCQGITCNQPPDSVCADEDTLKVFNSVGYCVAPDGAPECRYTSRKVACEGGCAEGKCLEAPCADVICDDPPARYCDGNDLVVWNTIPKCENGECLYGMQKIACVNGCVNGACMDDDTCANVICNTPPASYCVDGGTLRTFGRQGRCHEGACIYLHEDMSCEEACEEGHCTDVPF